MTGCGGLGPVVAGKEGQGAARFGPVGLGRASQERKGK